MTVHLLPGLGATPALFAGYNFPFPVRRLEYAKPPHPDCSFADYAQFLIRERDIQPGDGAIGVSLGGMMACEISKHVPLSKLTLVSSGTDRRHLHAVVHMLSFLGPRLPWALFKYLAVPVPGLSRSQHQAIEMFREADTSFVRWACSHAADWEGLDYHPDWCSIHGSLDPIFPIHLQTVHHIIPGGGHLMILDRRDEILPLLRIRHGDPSNTNAVK